MNLSFTGSRIEYMDDAASCPSSSIIIAWRKPDSLKKLLSAFAESTSPLIEIFDENKSLPEVDA